MFDHIDVSDCGRVKNRRTGTVLKQRPGAHGYVIVDIKEGGKRITKFVHRLVAVTFLPNPLNLPQVNHKDDNKANNNVENLEWCTVSYNNTYHGRAKKIGEHHRLHHPSRKAVRNVDTGDVYFSVNEAARQTGICRMSLAYALNGKQKTAGGFRWEVV